MARLPEQFARLAAAVEDLRRRARGRVREGRVVQADEANGLYRVDIGRGDSAFLTPWIPVEALSSGDLQIQAEPVVGQYVQVRSESGDLTDSIIALSSFDDSNPRPHGAGGELKVVVGSTSITGTADSLALACGGGSVTITSAGVAVAGGSLTHNGTNVGDTHTHGGVDTGGGFTAPPS